MSFEIGAQPDWANTDPCSVAPAGYVEGLLQEGVPTTLVSRSFGVIELEAGDVDLYSQFHEVFFAFMRSPMEERQKYAILQFDQSTSSPNQFHGFSQVGGLKQQFLMRVGGAETAADIPTPAAATNSSSSIDFGVVATRLYARLDDVCRHLARAACENMDARGELIDVILDPQLQHPTSTKPIDCVRVGGGVEARSYLPKGYISSSILDSLHYYKNDAPVTAEATHSDVHVNNHAAHTDRFV
jgi:hypothetical protein